MNWVTIKRMLANICQITPYLFSLLVPRCRKIWVFGAWFGYRYSDNSRYVFDYVSENEPSIRAVWISRDRRIVDEIRRSGKEAYFSGSWMGFWLCCRAYLAFITCGLPDVNRPGAYRAKMIQLWHGTPLKKIGLDDNITVNKNRSIIFKALKWVSRQFFPFTVERSDVVISPSRAVSPRLVTAFGVDPSKVVVTGYPRGDVILNSRPEPVKAVDRVLERYRAEKVVCYVPTHRCAGSEAFDPFLTLDTERLKACLSRHDAVLFVKMHYYHREQGLKDFSDCRMHMLNEAELADINVLLPHVDILITDYSSVYFDYLLLNRPIVFAPFDEERYVVVDRELYEDYDSVIPGPKCINWDEVIDELDRLLSGEDDYVRIRRDARSKYNDFCDTNNCRRVTELAKRVAGLSGKRGKERLKESMDEAHVLRTGT